MFVFEIKYSICNDTGTDFFHTIIHFHYLDGTKHRFQKAYTNKHVADWKGHNKYSRTGLTDHCLSVNSHLFSTHSVVRTGHSSSRPTLVIEEISIIFFLGFCRTFHNHMIWLYRLWNFEPELQLSLSFVGGKTCDSEILWIHVAVSVIRHNKTNFCLRHLSAYPKFIKHIHRISHNIKLINFYWTIEKSRPMR